MSLLNALKTAASSLHAQRERMNTIASNIANAETTRTAEGGPYKRLSPVFRTKVESFEAAMDEAAPSASVEVARIAQDTRAPRMVHDPDHPDADENGYVAMPNVSVVQEMVDMVSASRSYEASTSAVSTVKSMAQAALEIGS